MNKSTNSTTEVAPSAPVSYYDAMLAEINRRLDAAGMNPTTSKDVAAELRMSTSVLRRKLNGMQPLMLNDIGRLARVLGCRPSDLTPAPSVGTFKPDAENPNLEWGTDFEAGCCVIATHRLVDSGEVGLQFCEQPETMTPTEARQVAAILLAAADYLERG